MPLFLRGAISAAALALMFGGPIWVQLLGGFSGPWSRPWRMYSKVGLEVCTVAYEQPDGTALDRYELLRVKDPEPRRLLLKTVLDVHEEANKLCKRSKDLRVTAICTSGGPFETVLTPEEKLCP